MGRSVPVAAGRWRARYRPRRRRDPTEADHLTFQGIRGKPAATPRRWRCRLPRAPADRPARPGTVPTPPVPGCHDRGRERAHPSFRLARRCRYAIPGSPVPGFQGPRGPRVVLPGATVSHRGARLTATRPSPVDRRAGWGRSAPGHVVGVRPGPSDRHARTAAACGLHPRHPPSPVRFEPPGDREWIRGGKKAMRSTHGRCASRGDF